MQSNHSSSVQEDRLGQRMLESAEFQLAYQSPAIDGFSVGVDQPLDKYRGSEN